MAQKVLVIDNYDSFTYNLVQELGELGADSYVVRNDKAEVSQLAEMKFDKVIISPGPGRPENAGISIDVIRVLGQELKTPLLGVCLGHQSLAVCFGGSIVQAPTVVHGKLSNIFHEKIGIFEELESPFLATRYHSLVVDSETVPSELKITETTDDGLIMGLSHNSLPLHSVQFHPESLFTKVGYKLLNNFLSIY